MKQEKRNEVAVKVAKLLKGYGTDIFDCLDILQNLEDGYIKELENNVNNLDGEPSEGVMVCSGKENVGISSMGMKMAKYLNHDSINALNSQQPSEFANIQGEDGCTESLDSERNINSGFESSGVDSKKSSVDTSKSKGCRREFQSPLPKEKWDKCGDILDGELLLCSKCEKKSESVINSQEINKVRSHPRDESDSTTGAEQKTPGTSKSTDRKCKEEFDKDYAKKT